MIGRLQGRVCEHRPGELIIDCHGVGYQVRTTLRAYQQLAGADEVVLWTYLMVRQDQIELFGFANRDELQAFQQLISVAGVGPRIALAVLSGMSTGELQAAIGDGAYQKLQRTPGVGRKTAQRIVLELKGRLEATEQPSAGASVRDDAASALVNLGYSLRDAQRAVDTVLAGGSDELGEVLRRALAVLTR